MIFNNKKEQKTVEKFLNNHLLDFLKWAHRNEKDLNDGEFKLGDLKLSEIHQFTSAWIEEEAKLMHKSLNEDEKN